ncbi:hypothetical protein [Microbacterium esteraromaticum]|uniref:hypothetical protein n=1 Tax=Microbacterium esteraromaticum TaxID=57043 RepID=UPI001956A219|nr:hypothetical protein [Microbacterium esteraromaticum]MBM7464766.1 hypothetical protein [Microbacterium esteraromaticum]
MSTEEDGHTLTRKQLRELRLTGSTPVVGGEEAAAAAQPEPAELQVAEPSDETTAPTPSAGPQSVPPAASPLTRRAAREQERIRTGSVPVVATGEQPVADEPAVAQPVVDEPVVQQPVVDEPVIEQVTPDEPSVESPGLVSGIPAFAPQPAQAPRVDAPSEPADSEPAADEPAPFEPISAESGVDSQTEPTVGSAAAQVIETESEADRPMVGAAFGIGVKRSHGEHAAPAAFDELLESGSAGPHKTASTLIFTPSPGAGSLSGPVASTGELLITGTYQLPEGVGSQGHALGTTDGKDIDAVLLDGELAPASSPTPIAASSAISTSKPAGEVIRPPAPDKSNKLTLTLAIVAGGLALALAASLIIAFTSGVLG